jgi:hypothetical protein
LFSLPNNLTLLFNSEVDILKDTADSGYHTGFINLVNLSGTIAKDVTLYGELWSNINFDAPRTIQQYSFDTAIAYTVRPNFQIDAGLNIGLNRNLHSKSTWELHRDSRRRDRMHVVLDLL